MAKKKRRPPAAPPQTAQYLYGEAPGGVVHLYPGMPMKQPICMAGKGLLELLPSASRKPLDVPVRKLCTDCQVERFRRVKQLFAKPVAVEA